LTFRFDCHRDAITGPWCSPGRVSSTAGPLKLIDFTRRIFSPHCSGTSGRPKASDTQCQGRRLPSATENAISYSYGTSNVRLAPASTDRGGSRSIGGRRWRLAVHGSGSYLANSHVSAGRQSIHFEI
jgi:hypothetical protein